MKAREGKFADEDARLDRIARVLGCPRWIAMEVDAWMDWREARAGKKLDASIRGAFAFFQDFAGLNGLSSEFTWEVPDGR